MTTSAGQPIQRVADEIESTFVHGGCLLDIHTRRELECGDNGVVEEHLHWSSPLGATTVDVHVSHDAICARWTGSPGEWLTFRHDQVGALKPAIMKTQRLVFPNRSLDDGATAHLTSLDPLSVGEILNWLPFEDVRHLLQTHDRLLVRNISAATNVDRVEALTAEDVSWSTNTPLLRRVFPSVRVIRIRALCKTKPRLRYTQHLPRSIVSFEMPRYTILRFHEKDVEEPFLNLHTLAVGTLYAPLPLEVFMPSLTSLNIQTETGESGLQCDVATLLPSMLHELSICADGWRSLAGARDETWPFLHTLTIRHSSRADCSTETFPDASRCPSLTRLTLHDVTFSNGFNLDVMTDMHCLRHLTLQTPNDSVLISLLRATNQPLPMRLTSIEIDTSSDELIEPHFINHHLLRLLPPSTEKIMSSSLGTSTSSFDELLALTSLTRICLRDDELYRRVVDGKSMWESFCLLAQKPNVGVHEFECFELLYSRLPAESSELQAIRITPNNGDCMFFRAVSDLMDNCPALGLKVASHYPDSLWYLNQFSSHAVRHWLKHSTQHCFDFKALTLWVRLLREMDQRRDTLSLEQLADTLQHHATHTHPILFRYLLHIVFVLSVEWDGRVALSPSPAESLPSGPISLLSSQYGYKNALQCAPSCLTLVSLKRFMLRDNWYDSDHSVWETFIAMLERPSWAQSCCNGDVASTWFDLFPIWRAASIVRNMLLDVIDDRLTKEDGEETGTMTTVVETHATIVQIDIKEHCHGHGSRQNKHFIRVDQRDRHRGEARISIVNSDTEETRFSWLSHSLDETKSLAAQAVSHFKM